MQVPTNGAQRASRHRTIRLMVMSALALSLAMTGLATGPEPVTAGGVKVTIIVGPVESSTDRYRDHARGYADLARSLGATVVEVYSPNATWKRVKAAARGANILIYLGHGNGSPSPYGAFSPLRRNGMGLNATAGNGNRNVKYYGQWWMNHRLDLAKDSVVLLNHLCYASGNSEPGRKLPSTSTAKQRADGYGSGFFRAGARAVFANGHGSLSSIIVDLLTSDKNVGQIFQDDPAYDGGRDWKFGSAKTSFSTVWMDPESKGRYYHAVSGKLGLDASAVRAGD